MITINKCNIIGSEGRTLLLDISISSESYFANRTISKIYIDTEDQYTIAGPSGENTFTISDVNDTKYQDSIDIDGFLKNLFFIYVVETGELASDTPCGMKDDITTIVVYNGTLLDAMGAGYIHSNNSCTPNKGFIDFVLKERLFKYALELGHYTLAIKIWKDFFNSSNPQVAYDCGCHS